MKKTLFWGICFLFIFIFAQAGTACDINFAGDYGISWTNEGFTTRLDPYVTEDGCTKSAYVVFKDYEGNVLGKGGPWTITGTDTVYYYVTINLQSPTPIEIYADLYEALGDVNSDASVDLQDTLLFLKGMTAIAAPGSMNPGADVNGDNKLCLEDAIYTLQIVSGLKEPVLEDTAYLF